METHALESESLQIQPCILAYTTYYTKIKAKSDFSFLNSYKFNL